MENEFDEVDANPHNPNRVRISITRASFSEEEGEPEETGNSRPRADSDSSIDEKEMEKLMQEDDNNENEQLQNGEGGGSHEQNDSASNDIVVKDERTAEDEEVSKAFENGVTLNDDGDSASERPESVEKTNDESGELQSKDGEDSQESPEKSPAMEMIGDRVLIERDGKFELVDVSEIKAEYYDMLGISPDTQNNDAENTTESEGTASETTENNAKDIEDEKPEPRRRPKTTSVHELQRRNEKKKTARVADRTRSQSAKAARQRNDEYSHIRSEYAMTEQQLEIRRKCKEAKLRRQKEEQEREREEQQRKREDADRAFQAWLYAKIESAQQARLNQPDPNAEKEMKEARQKDAVAAYSEWVEMKRKQNKALREMEGKRRADEAAQYAIRDRQLCDEAFRRWLKKKKQIEQAKIAARKKKKPVKLKRKEQPPLNSPKNRYYEYYGYRNNVVL